ncbi:MAG: SURF1 family protein [Gemmatimonadales bacterium]|nr:SURF1 family protein [Candidatus Palauibacter irciniicola]
MPVGHHAAARSFDERGFVPAIPEGTQEIIGERLLRDGDRGVGALENHRGKIGEPVAVRQGGREPACGCVRHPDRIDSCAVTINRRILLCAVALALGALFIRLGFWQLDRHGERSAGVRARAERADAPRLQWMSPGDVPPDTAGLIGRRARLAGRWDRAGEVILRSRTLDGRAGAEGLTPFLVGGDAGQVVMVLRGWLPAPDGLRPDLASGWTEPPGDARASAAVEGVLVSSRDGRGGQPLQTEIAGAQHLAIAGLDLALIREQTALEPTPHVLRADDPPLGGALRPARALETDSGPHLSYAIQWFAFAVIGLGGTAILLRSSGDRTSPSERKRP